jgi:uncharacterized SAM-binding protein YcdF (DUF218 family)
MFFFLSKIFWAVFHPGNLLLLALCVGVVLLWTRWRRGARYLLSLTAVAAFLLATIPIGTVLSLALEERFPIPRDLPAKVDGIISLGGVVDQFITEARGQVAVGGGVERLTELAALARRYPSARLVYASGSGSLLRQDIKEADVIDPFLRSLGLDPERVMRENQSRNTYENAVMARDLARPGTDETWILITSAFHMPRAVGCFRRAGWRVIPYPVDFAYRGDERLGVTFSLTGGIGGLAGALHEWIGLAAYRLSDRTSAFFPAPDG